MGTKGKKGFRFLKIFSVFFLVLGIALGGAVLGLRMPQNSVSDTTVQTQGNDLTLNQNFTENPYVIVGDKVYTYLQIQQQQADVNPTTPTATVQTLNFDNNGKLELVFYKENATQLNSAQTLQFTDEDIASQFQATKNEDGTISIQIIDTSDVVEITTSTDADYTLYGLAFSTQATLNYANGEFSIGEKRSATSFTDTTAKSTTQILNLSGGSFKFSGAKTYSPKAETEGRAFYQTGGTLTLDGITLDGFWVNNTIETNYGGAVLNMGGTLNLNCTIKNSNAYAGGAIGNMGVMDITGGTYSDNTALVGGGALANVGMATINGGIFTENSSNYAGAIYNTMGQLTINDVAIYGNESVDYGGAIFNDSNLGYCYLIINGGEIYNNKTNSSGGAIANECSLTINGGEIYENTAGEYGGAVCLPDYENNAILNITGGTFSQNTAVSGGAIYVYAKGTTTNVSTTISDGTFSENSAVYSESDTSQFSGGGGAIIVGNGTFDITGGEFLNNTATMGGGALGSLVATNISNATFTGNMATDQEFETLGGAVAFQNEVEVVISNCTFTENSSVLGSAVAALYGPTVTMSNCNVSGNQAMAGTLAALEADIMVMGSSTITQNQAMASTIAIVQGGIFGMDNNVSATENHSDMGAMMIVIEGYLGLTGCTVEDNTYGESLEIPGDIALIEDAAIIVAGELTSNYEVFVQPATAGTLVAGWVDSSMTSLMPTALEHLLLVGVDEETILTLNSENLIVIGSTGLAPGVYVYGTDELIYDWATLVAGGIISVSNGTISMSEDAVDALGSSLNGAKAKIVFDSSVTTIPDQFMAEASGIASLIFPSSITSVGMLAFGMMEELEEVIFKDSYVSFGLGAFALCSALRFLDLGENVRSIGDLAFTITPQIEECTVTIGPNTSFGRYAFLCSGVDDFLVDSNHTQITNLNGLICSKDLSLLYICVSGKTGSVTVPESVQIIQYGAFAMCNNLTGQVVLPNGLTQICETEYTLPALSNLNLPMLLAYIGMGLFSGASMPSVVLPENITALPDCTFSGCPNLNDITWPTNLQTIGPKCFSDCDGLIDIVIPNTVTSIGSECFSGCDNLKTADLGDGITSIGERLFYQAPALEWVDIGASTTTIQKMAFYQCPSLKTVVWNSVLQTIGLSSFYQCSSLQGTFTAPSALTTISAHAFQDCTSLTGVVFNSNLTELGDHAFQGCTGLTGTLTIPNSVTTISRQAFQDCSGLTRLSMGNNVTTIGDLAFYNCNQISGSLSLPNTLVTIGQSAFRSMPGLTGTLTLGSSMQTVGSYAFRDCTGFTTLYVYGNNLTLGEQAFYNCTGLTTLSLNSGLLSIGDSAFYGCNKIYGRLTIPNTTTTIANNAFYNCSRFTGLTLGSSVTTIGDTAFYGCSGMSGSVTFPTTLQTIGKSAFRSLKLTGSINLPSIVTIGESAFQACTGFTSLKIGDTATTVDSLAFYGCTGLTSMDLGTGIQTIGQSAFRNCSNAVGTIKLPNIQVIGNYAFHTASKITSVTIGGTITQVGDGVFANCTSILTHYYIDCTSIPTLTNANCFNNINANCKIWVPGALYEDWIVATNWSNWEPYIYAYEEQAPGLYNIDTGEIIYTWQQLLDNNMVTVSNGVLAGSNTSMAGLLVIATSVTDIAESAFASYTGLTGVTIPRSILSIGFNAFDGCTGLQVINWKANKITSFSGYHNTFKDVGESSPTGCHVILGDNITIVPAYMFFNETSGDSSMNHEGITDVTIPEGVTTIGEYAFNLCQNIRTAWVIPSTVSRIETSAFGGTNLTGDFIIHDNVTYIGDYAFEGCEFTSITISKSVSYIGTAAFGSCGKYLENITVDNDNAFYHSDQNCLINTSTNELMAGCSSSTIPTYVTVIGKCAFQECKNLLSITIPSSVKKILTYAFADSGLTSIIIPDSVTQIEEYAFSSCDSLETATLGNGLTVLEHDLFHMCTSLTSCNMSSSIKEIQGQVFYGTKLTTLTIPKSVTTINSYAFNGAGSILTYYFTEHTSIPTLGGDAFRSIVDGAKIYVPQSLYNSWKSATNWSTYASYITYLNSDAGGLYNSSGTMVYTWQQLIDNNYITVEGTTLTSIASFESNLEGKLVVSSSITAIGDSIGSLSYITGLVIPDSVTTIGSGLLNSATRATSLEIGSGVTAIGSNMFGGSSYFPCVVETITVSSANQYYCAINNLLYNKNKTKLIAVAPKVSGGVTIQSTVTEIVDAAFKDRTGVTSVSMGSSIATIGADTFYGCTGLTTITLPTALTSIGTNAFYGCTSLNAINIPSNVTSIGENAFYNCDAISKVNITNMTSWLNINFANSNAQPVNNNGGLYLNGSLVTSVSVPSGKTAINPYVFKNVDSLSTITIPATVTSIGNYAFYNCSGLTTVNISNMTSWLNIDFVDEYAQPLRYAGNLYLSGSTVTSVSVPTSITNIKNYVFWGLDSLQSITLHSNIKSIGIRAFSGSGLTSINLNASTVTSIGNYAFYYCDGLTSIVMPNTVTTLGTNVFDNCASLTSVTMSSNLTSIPDYTFNKCSLLSNVTIPSSVTSIGAYAFYDCKTVYTLGNTGSEELIIPDNVTSIGTYAFYNNEARVIRFGSSSSKLASLGDHAFYNCMWVVFYDFTKAQVVPSLGGWTFDGEAHAYTLKFIVPPSLYDSWVASWTLYAEYIEPNTVASNANVTFYNGNQDFNNLSSSTEVTIMVSHKEDEIENDIDDDSNNDITGGGDGNNDGTNASANVPTKTTAT